MIDNPITALNAQIAALMKEMELLRKAVEGAYNPFPYIYPTPDLKVIPTPPYVPAMYEEFLADNFDNGKEPPVLQPWQGNK